MAVRVKGRLGIGSNLPSAVWEIVSEIFGSGCPLVRQTSLVKVYGSLHRFYKLWVTDYES